jgi:hypothetical protein
LYEFKIYHKNNHSHLKNLLFEISQAIANAEFFQEVFHLEKVFQRFFIHCTEKASGISGVTK